MLDIAGSVIYDNDMNDTYDANPRGITEEEYDDPILYVQRFYRENNLTEDDIDGKLNLLAKELKREVEVVSEELKSKYAAVFSEMDWKKMTLEDLEGDFIREFVDPYYSDGENKTEKETFYVRLRLLIHQFKDMSEEDIFTVLSSLFGDVYCDGWGDGSNDDCGGGFFEHPSNRYCFSIEEIKKRNREHS